MSLPLPSALRKRSRPARYQPGNAEPEFPKSLEDHFNRIWNESFDLAMHMEFEGIKQRFDQPWYNVMKNSEGLLAKAANGKAVDQELAAFEKIYPGVFDSNALTVQLKYVQAQLGECSGDNLFSWRNVLDMVKQLTNAQKPIDRLRIVRILKLLLLIPATNAVSERSASALRHTKTYLRSTMAQPRLNHCMLLHVYKEDTSCFPLTEVANQFVSNENRERMFGKFPL